MGGGVRSGAIRLGRSISVTDTQAAQPIHIDRCRIPNIAFPLSIGGIPVGTADDAIPLFHRKANPRTQTITIAVQQNKTGELWGRGAFGGLPAALAYVGSIGEREEGTEFTTDIPYARNGHPQWAYWYLPENGGNGRVRHQLRGAGSFACVDIEPLLNRYRCRQPREDLD